MRRYKSAFDTQTFTVQRYSPSYLDDDNNLVTPDSNTFLITGDMQPYKLVQTQQVEAPTGYTLKDAKYLSSKDDLDTMDDVTATRSDTITMDGRKFYVWRKADYSAGVLSTDAYTHYILIMERLPNEGSP